MDDLVTERLLLHPMSAAEAGRVVAREPGEGDRWAAGYPDQGDVAGASRFLATCASGGDPRPFGNYEIRRREDGLAIGGVGFHGPPDASGAVTVGYGLIPAARGRGYAVEALRGLLRLARDLGVVCVRGDADHGNTASHRVMAAAGMRLVGSDERVRYYETVWPRTPARPGAGSAAVATDEQGGEPACLLNRLCPDCDAVLDSPRPALCPRCGAVTGPDRG